MGFDLTVVDTSAVWNPMAKRYLRRQASESLPDLIGNFGPTSVWICLLYTFDAADDTYRVAFGGRRFHKIQKRIPSI